MNRMAFFLLIITPVSVFSADMDAMSYDRVVHAICKDNTDVKLCNKLVANLMFQVKSNGELSAMCNQIDESGGDSSVKPACVNARTIDKYIDKKQNASN
ncbi:hypothetical protein QT13_01980 [Pectobacterium brasiliense]|nr:hypothetical protein QT13_01980 [Pectobacterium brasiliense]